MPSDKPHQTTVDEQLAEVGHGTIECEGPECSARIPVKDPNTRGRQKTTCSDACRQAAYRKRSSRGRYYPSTWTRTAGGPERGANPNRYNYR